MGIVDHIKIIYKKIFTVRFLHEGYTGLNQDIISGAISVKPDEETMQLFANHKMLYRFYNDHLMCFMQCNIFLQPGDEPKSIPHINFINEEVRIRFLIKASTEFLNRTIITAVGAREVYQFSNKSNAGLNMVITGDAEGVKDIVDLKQFEQVDPDESCLAVIDIYTGNIPDNVYKMFDTEHMLVDNPPEYKIIFTKK